MSSPAAGAVLPVDENAIANTATAQALRVDSVLVENNVDAAGKSTDDQFEIVRSNTEVTDLGGVEIFYTFADPTTATPGSCYTKLPADFTISKKGKQVVHFAARGLADHFPANKFSPYFTNKNALDVTVVASAEGVAEQITKLQKRAGGAEAVDGRDVECTRT
jgi:hypothetical protein